MQAAWVLGLDEEEEEEDEREGVVVSGRWTHGEDGGVCEV